MLGDPTNNAQKEPRPPDLAAADYIADFFNEGLRDAEDLPAFVEGILELHRSGACSAHIAACVLANTIDCGHDQPGFLITALTQLEEDSGAFSIWSGTQLVHAKLKLGAEMDAFLHYIGLARADATLPHFKKGGETFWIVRPPRSVVRAHFPALK